MADAVPEHRINHVLYLDPRADGLLKAGVVASGHIFLALSIYKRRSVFHSTNIFPTHYDKPGTGTASVPS